MVAARFTIIINGSPDPAAVASGCLIRVRNVPVEANMHHIITLAEQLIPVPCIFFWAGFEDNPKPFNWCRIQLQTPRNAVLAARKLDGVLFLGVFLKAEVIDGDQRLDSLQGHQLGSSVSVVNAATSPLHFPTAPIVLPGPAPSTPTPAVKAAKPTLALPAPARGEATSKYSPDPDAKGATIQPPPSRSSAAKAAISNSKRPREWIYDPEHPSNCRDAFFEDYARLKEQYEEFGIASGFTIGADYEGKQKFISRQYPSPAPANENARGVFIPIVRHDENGPEFNVISRRNLADVYGVGWSEWDHPERPTDMAQNDRDLRP